MPFSLGEEHLLLPNDRKLPYLPKQTWNIANHFNYSQQTEIFMFQCEKCRYNSEVTHTEKTIDGFISHYYQWAEEEVLIPHHDDFLEVVNMKDVNITWIRSIKRHHVDAHLTNQQLKIIDDLGGAHPLIKIPLKEFPSSIEELYNRIRIYLTFS